MTYFNALDEQFMNEAIAIARQHLGKTAENPSVGAVIVSHQYGKPRIVGRGITAIGGRPHAEPQALKAAGEKAHGATLYVTLEPCCHYGKTPPCTQAIIAAGISRVVIAVGDTDRRVDGGGIAQLRQAGIIVEVGCQRDKAAQDLGSYLCFKKFHRPFITAKLAVSADGYIGRKNEGKIAITGSETQVYVHNLRAQHDAIMIGIGTALADNPHLDCRASSVNPKAHPIRIILDSSLQLPTDSNLVRSALRQPVWIICSKKAPAEKYMQLEQLGCKIVECDNEVSQTDLTRVLHLLAKLGVRSILLEGGAKLMQSFWNEGLIDQLILLKSKLIIGENGYKQPNFTNKQDYQLVREQNIADDFVQSWLHLYGKNGFLP